MTPIPEGEIAKALEAYREHGSYMKAAAATGIGATTIRTHVHKAAEKGALGFTPVLPGFTIKQMSGQANGAWVKQVKAPGEVFQMPAGQIVKGVSALVDPDGREIMKWVKTKADSVVPDLVAALEARFEKHERPLWFDTEPSGTTEDDLLSVYPIADQHLGLLAWGRETGEAYDIKIGAGRLRECTQRLVAQSPASTSALILNLGDWQHTDDGRNVTPGHGNALDVDSRYFKIVEAGVDLMVDIIELALQKHAKVLVRNLPGNHDPHAHVALTMGLRGHYRNHPRVEIIVEPSDFFYYRFGKVLIGATHGHKLRPPKMVMDMAVTRRDDWAAADYRYFYFGHIHHETALETGDVRCESFQTVASKDAYASSHGYTAGRSLTSITHHKRDGEIGRHRVNIPPPRRAK